jgi:hypothetical protein
MQELDHILADLEALPASTELVEIYRELGYSAHLVDEIDRLPRATGVLDPRSQRLEVLRRLERGERYATVAHELRHGWHHVSGVLGFVEDSPPAHLASAILLTEADAMTFEIHVADQLRRLGREFVWDRLRESKVLAKAMSAYEDALDYGLDEADACSWAFREVTGHGPFQEACRRQAEEFAERPEYLESDHDPDALERLGEMLRLNSPSGAPYSLAFDEAVYEASISFGDERPEWMPSGAPGM